MHGWFAVEQGTVHGTRVESGQVLLALSCMPAGQPGQLAVRDQSSKLASCWLR